MIKTVIMIKAVIYIFTYLWQLYSYAWHFWSNWIIHEKE